jgi:hypothetical protein
MLSGQVTTHDLQKKIIIVYFWISQPLVRSQTSFRRENVNKSTISKSNHGFKTFFLLLPMPHVSKNHVHLARVGTFLKE